MDLFEQAAEEGARKLAPLADRMRPRTLSEFVGQEAAAGPGAPLRRAVEEDRLFSMILWGPPGCGKTTLAALIAAHSKARFERISAVLSGVREIRAVIEGARDTWVRVRRRTILFVDEIHRFNKSQQDAFLPHVESGRIILIGATTENPSFEVIPALVSRCRVIPLSALSEQALGAILDRALSDAERGLGGLGLRLTETARDHLIAAADGDARMALNNLELAARLKAGEGGAAPAPEAGPREIRAADVLNAIGRKALLYDKSGDAHYDLISAFIKSMRGGDPDAALYWMARMLAAGETPLYLARRMVRFATEDVGNADPRALRVALDAMEAHRFLGSPEGDLALAQAAVYLAAAPRSNSVYMAFKAARAAVDRTGSLAVPYHIRNAPTALMRSLGYGRDYQYDHDAPEGHAAGQTFLPEPMAGTVFYRPTDRGHERVIGRRLGARRKMGTV